MTSSFLLLNNTRSGLLLVDPFVSENPREFRASHSLGKVLVFASIIFSRGQIVLSCTIPSRSPFLPNWLIAVAIFVFGEDGYQRVGCSSSVRFVVFLHAFRSFSQSFDVDIFMNMGYVWGYSFYFTKPFFLHMILQVRAFHAIIHLHPSIWRLFRWSGEMLILRQYSPAYLFHWYILCILLVKYAEVLRRIATIFNDQFLFKLRKNRHVLL